MLKVILDELKNAKFTKHLDSAEIKLDVLPNNQYALGHLYRMEQTFNHLRNFVTGTETKVVDLGTNTIYHPELKDIFPVAELHFSGGKKDPNWFSLNLETDKLPFEDNSCDVVLLLEVVEHFYEDPMFCIAEINRILKLDGLLVITTPNILSIRSVFASLCGYAPYFHAKYERFPNARRHVHEYAPYQLKDLVKSGGFAEHVWTENVYMKDIPALEQLLDAWGFPGQDRGDTLFCCSKKTGPVLNRYPSMLYTA